MTRFAAFNLLFVAWATRSAAQTAPGDVPNDTIFLYKDTAVRPKDDLTYGIPADSYNNLVQQFHL